MIEELEKVKIDKEDVNKIEELLNYEYPHKIDIIIPTKTAVTTLKDLKNNNIVEENITLSKPKFLNETKEEIITPSKKGTIMHLCCNT